MISQQQLDALQDELHDLRRDVVAGQADEAQVHDLFDRTNRLLAQAHGTDYEPALGSIASLLGSVRRNLEQKKQLRLLGLERDRDSAAA